MMCEYKRGTKTPAISDNFPLGTGGRERLSKKPWCSGKSPNMQDIKHVDRWRWRSVNTLGRLDSTEMIGLIIVYKMPWVSPSPPWLTFYVVINSRISLGSLVLLLSIRYMNSSSFRDPRERAPCSRRSDEVVCLYAIVGLFLLISILCLRRGYLLWYHPDQMWVLIVVVTFDVVQATISKLSKKCTHPERVCNGRTLSEWLRKGFLLLDAREQETNFASERFNTDGNPTEYLCAEDTYSPLVHRINQVIGHRAVHPDDPIPPPIDILTKFSHPPADLIKGSEKVQQKLIETFNVKKGPFMPNLSKIDQS